MLYSASAMPMTFSPAVLPAPLQSGAAFHGVPTDYSTAPFYSTRVLLNQPATDFRRFTPELEADIAVRGSGLWNPEPIRFAVPSYPVEFAAPAAKLAAEMPVPAYASFNDFKNRADFKKLQQEGTLLILSRHGESLFNRVNVINGPNNSPLLDSGASQAHDLAKTLSDFPVDAIFSSPLERAYRTAEILQQELGVPNGMRIEDDLSEMERGILAGRPKKMNSAEVDVFFSRFDDPQWREEFKNKYGLNDDQLDIVISECRKWRALLQQHANKAGMSEDDYVAKISACENTLDCEPPMGESFRQQMRKLEHYKNDHLDRFGPGSTLLMSHGMTHRILMMTLLGIPMQSLDQLYAVDQVFGCINVLYKPNGSTTWQLLVLNSDRFGN